MGEGWEAALGAGKAGGSGGTGLAGAGGEGLGLGGRGGGGGAVRLRAPEIQGVELAKNLLLGARGEGQLRWNPKTLQGKGFAACVPTLFPSSAALLAALLGIAGIGFLRKRRLAG